MAPINSTLSYAEALQWIQRPKRGVAPEDWRPDVGRPFSQTDAFGLTDPDGTRIQGLTVQLVYRQSKRIHIPTFTAGMFVRESGKLWRIYQATMSFDPGLPPHRNPDGTLIVGSHEHIGDRAQSIAFDSSWTFDHQMRYFLKNAGIDLDGIVADPSQLRLTP